jgi:hypothetical protein
MEGIRLSSSVALWQVGVKLTVMFVDDSFLAKVV